MKEEAKMLAKLHHPNIVDVVTAGITQDGMRVPYYVMERLNGVNLRHMLEKKGALDLVHALRVAIDVLDALEHAHEHGVVHRDVKPENIFLHRNASGTTTTKLLGFGIMRLLDRKSTDVGRGKFVGTIRYASPEQIMGEPVEAASDLYAMGLLLYEMIAGRGPFDEVNEAYAIGMAHVTRPPPPLSQLAREVPPEIEQIVHAALAKKAADRPRDAYTFSTELRRLVPGGPLSPPVPRVMTPVTPVTPSHPMAFVATEAHVTPVRFTPVDAIAINSSSNANSNANATSMAGEARTRPPSPASFVLPIAVAGVIGAAVVAAAVIYVMRAPPPTILPPPAAASAAPLGSATVPTPSSERMASTASASAPAPSESAAARPKAPLLPRTPATPKKPLRPEDVGFE
jgi:serine/threonine-protein kinase